MASAETLRSCFVRCLVAALACSGAAHAGGDEAWLARLEAARGSVAAAAPEVASKACEEAWRDIARDHPLQTDWLLQDLGAGAQSLLSARDHEAASRRLGAIAGAAASSPPGAQLRAWLEHAYARRSARIGGMLARWAPFAFTEGHTVHMSFIGYTEGLSDARAERFFRPGSRLALLEFAPGSTIGARRTLVDDPHGMLRDVDTSFDRERLVYAWKRSDRLDDYHIHEWRLADGAQRQLTFGLGRADYEPVCLPDGDIVFASTRPEQSVPCWWTEISNLYRMDPDGLRVRRLAVDQVHTLYPQTLADGRLVYTRWDYNDRGQNYPHPVFAMRPDGQDQRAYYGGNSWFPTSLLHTRGIPGSHKAVSIAAGHHTLQQGKLVLLDPRVGRDEGAGMEFVAPRRVVPYERVDAAMQDGELFRYPYPLSEQEFLVSYKPAFGVERFGLYWMDADGARELLHADGELDVARMVPLGLKPAVALLDDEVDATRPTGTYYVHDVYLGTGLEGVPRGTAKTIRVVELDYRAAGVGQTYNGGEGGGSLNSAPVAVANGSWDVKRILGDADIHADGSALFEVPAMASIYLQVLDEKGRAIQTTRSWDTLRPGEQKGCLGCHEKSDGNRHPYAQEDTLAWKRGVQKLRPFYGAPRGFSFPREIQPILDAKCVACHDGTREGAVDLRGEPVDGANLAKRAWSRSYLALVEAVQESNGNWTATPETGLVSWISKMSRPTELPPYFAGAARSRLLPLLESGHQGATLAPEELHKLAAWMDLLVPYCGDYREGAAWSPDEHRYYSYYEGKRAVQAAEERAAVAAQVELRAGGSSRPAAAPARFVQAAYREVLRGPVLQERDGLLRVPELAAPGLVDRVRLVVHGVQGRAGGEVRVRLLHAEDRRELAAAQLPLDGTPRELHLSTPVRTDLLAAVLEGDAGEGAVVRIAGAWGVLVDEVPALDGWHPVLDIRSGE